jgi:hypothetical protein
VRTVQLTAGCNNPHDAKWHVWGQGKAAGFCRRSLDDVHSAKPKSLYKRAIYPPPAIQNRTDICAINAITIRKSVKGLLPITDREPSQEKRK